MKTKYRYLAIKDEEGNGNPLQYSCLENPRYRGAWWGAICGVAQSGTRLKRLSSSSSSSYKRIVILNYLFIICIMEYYSVNS